jgi:hypothetical protein
LNKKGGGDTEMTKEREENGETKPEDERRMRKAED